MAQVPCSTNEAELFVTVQTLGVSDAKLTVSPLLAVAESATVLSAGCNAIPGKVMVCGTRSTSMF